MIDLSTLYRRYIDCLNRRDWASLGQFVDPDVIHNGRPLGLAGYRAMLVRDVADIPDLRFEVALLVAEPPPDSRHLAARLRFDCTPRGRFLDLPVDGRRVAFTENVFYRIRSDRIEEVWSVVDKAAIEAQL